MLFLSTEWTHRDGALITQNIKAEICDNSFSAGKINSLQFYKWRKVMMIIIWSPWIIYRDMNSRHFLRMVLLSRVNCFCSQNPSYLYINVQHCFPVEALELSCTHGFRKAVLPRLKWIVSELRSQATIVTFDNKLWSEDMTLPSVYGNYLFIFLPYEQAWMKPSNQVSGVHLIIFVWKWDTSFTKVPILEYKF